MSQNKVVSQKEWLEARIELLKEEKEHTRKSDELAKRRQELPWVKIEKKYEFDTENGRATLTDLFQGRSQLMVYHFMFGPSYTAGCPSCSSIADGINGSYIHLANHDVTLMAVSSAKIEKLLGYRKRMGWGFPWASSVNAEFNHDFQATFTEVQQSVEGIKYNYRQEPPVKITLAGKNMKEWEADPVQIFANSTGTDVPAYTRERPGISSFIKVGGEVYHTYSTYARGVDGIWGMYQWLDRAPKGRNENGVWWKRHDEY